MNTQEIPIATAAADIPLYQASKWLEVHFLVDMSELRELLQSLSPLFICTAGKAVEKGSSIIEMEEILKSYELYIQEIKNETAPTDRNFDALFTLLLTRSLTDLRSLRVGVGKELVKIINPVIQILPHKIHYSSIENKFRSSSLGKNTISWGLHISFPQFFQNPETLEIEKPLLKNTPNAVCFKEIQKWIRRHTLPVKFQAQDTQVVTPIRLGRSCFSWINRHPQLKSQSITVIQP